VAWLLISAVSISKNSTGRGSRLKYLRGNASLKSRRRVASAEGGRIEALKAPSGVEYRNPQPTMGSGEHRELPQRGPRNAFWRIFKATERSFLHLYAEVFFFGGGARARFGTGSIRYAVSSYTVSNL